MKEILLLAFTILAMSLSSNSLAGDVESSKVEVVLESASPTGKMGRHWRVFSYNDPTCEAKEKGKKVARKRRNQPLAPLNLPSKQPVTLAFLYIEADYGTNRECSYTWTFTPQAGTNYKVAFKVSPVVTCSIALTTSDGTPVEYLAPINSCAIGLYGQKVPNGERATITHKMTFY